MTKPYLKIKAEKQRKAPKGAFFDIALSIFCNYARIIANKSLESKEIITLSRLIGVCNSLIYNNNLLRPTVIDLFDIELIHNEFLRHE